MAVPLSARLGAFLELFALRKDVHVASNLVLSGLSSREAKKLETELPSELFAFARDFGGADFSWALAERVGELAGFSEGSRGGRLNIRSFRKLEYVAPEEWEPWAKKITARAGFDVFVAEGQTWLVHQKGKSKTEAVLMFNEDSTLTKMGSLEEYLTLGARRAFVWYWQVDDAEGRAMLDTLLARSMPTSTPAPKLQDLLVQRGASAQMADALISWLGKDVVVLLEAKP